MCLVVFIVISCPPLFNKIDTCFSSGKAFKVLAKSLYPSTSALFTFTIASPNLNGDASPGFLTMIFLILRQFEVRFQLVLNIQVHFL